MIVSFTKITINEQILLRKILNCTIQICKHKYICMKLKSILILVNKILLTFVGFIAVKNALNFRITQCNVLFVQKTKNLISL